MDDIYDFYSSILNIDNKDDRITLNLIKTITKEEMDKILTISSDTDGYCKILASQIGNRLNEYGIHHYWIDLEDLVKVDHTVLIAEYKTGNTIKRYLIDPSFSQFNKRESHYLLSLSQWPSEKIKDQGMVRDLLQEGITLIDDVRWTDYLQAFTNQKINVNLAECLLDNSLRYISSKNKK